MADRPLEGRRVLLTRPEGRGRGLAGRLEALGARVDLRPTIAFEAPTDRGPVERAVGALERYAWIVITSPTGAGFFLDAVAEAGCTIDPGGPRFAVVGPGTARRLADAGVAVAVVARKNDADGLAAELGDPVKRGERVLVVRPEESREVLPEALADIGAEVDAITFYRTVPAQECREIARDVGAGTYDAIVFTSPSTFRALDDRLRRVPRWRETIKVAIGRVTAEAMDRRSMAPDSVADRPTDEALAEALVEAFRR